MSQNEKREAKEDVREIARVSLLASGLSMFACVMGLSLSLAYGATAAKMKVANAATVITASDFAGRWSGTYASYGATRAKCEGGPCKLTLDIAPCDKGWCGVLVKDDGTCGAKAMTAEVEKGSENFVRLNGRLDFEPRAASYAIQATLWASDGGIKSLDIIGDTGKELVMMRRSFPFSAHLARSGDAVCTSDKATS